VVDLVKAEYKIEPEWRPYYLYWDVPPEGMELSEHIKQARAHGSEEHLAQIAGSYDMPYVPTPRIYNTRLAHEATEYAREQGKANAFHRAVFHKVFAESRDVGQWEVLRAAAREAGLNADEMQSEVESGKYTADVAGQVERAYRMGVSGVPTHVINDRYAIVGAQPFEVFKQALTRILNEKV